MTLRPPQPNVLFLTADQLRTDALGCYGGVAARTPHLDALAARGVRFEQAYVAAPECVPSRATWLTGRYPPEHGALSNELPVHSTNGRPTLYNAARRAGYTVSLLGKTHYVPPLDEFEGVSVYRPYEPDGRTPNRTADATLEGLLVQSFRGFLAYAGLARPNRPWFVHLSFVNPHPPALCANLPIGYAPVSAARLAAQPITLSDAELDAWRRLCKSSCNSSWSRDEYVQKFTRDRQCYYATVEYVDAMVGRALALVNLTTTLVLFTADHGSQLGDHGHAQKSVFYDASWRVPLLLAGVGVARRAGGVERAYACGIDVPTTLRLAMQAYADDHLGVDLRRLPVEEEVVNSECVGFLGRQWRATVGAHEKAIYMNKRLVQRYARTRGTDPREEHNQVQ